MTRLLVLTVDDESMLLTTFTRLLRAHYDVRVASSANEALDVLAKEHVDVLVSDYSMPGMNGLELLERVASEHPEIVRLLSTAHGAAPEVVSAKQNGLFELVEKPWSREVMLGAIDRARQAAARSP